jgi:hypothetical protein
MRQQLPEDPCPHPIVSCCLCNPHDLRRPIAHGLNPRCEAGQSGCCQDLLLLDLEMAMTWFDFLLCHLHQTERFGS